jgi:hypothetical protein
MILFNELIFKFLYLHITWVNLRASFVFNAKV